MAGLPETTTAVEMKDSPLAASAERSDKAKEVMPCVDAPAAPSSPAADASAQTTLHQTPSPATNDESEARRVCVCVDDSPHSEKAWLWVLDKFLRPDDIVVLTTACVVSGGVGTRHTVTPEEEKALHDVSETTAALMHKFVEVGVASPNAGLNKDRIEFKTLLAPRASDIGETIVDYLDHGVPATDVVVLGSRGMGAFRRAMSPLIGLGSVSDYVLHNSGKCQGVMIVKPEADAQTTTV